MERYKAGCFDVDGTLFTGEGPGDDGVLEFLRLLPVKSFVTSRSIDQLESALPDNDLRGFPVAVLGGSEIWAIRGEVIRSHLLEEEHKRDLAKILREKVAGLRSARFQYAGKREVVVFADSQTTEVKYRELFEKVGTKVRTTLDIEEFIAEFLASATTSLSLRTHEGKFELTPEERERLNVDTESKNNAFIFYARGIDKGTALREICEILNISPDEVVSAGDTENVDTKMFEISHGIAVGKALSWASERVVSPVELRERLRQLLA